MFTFVSISYGMIFSSLQSAVALHRWRPLVTSLCCYGYRGNPLSSNCFLLIESAKNAYYMCQRSNQSEEWCQKYVEGRDPINPPPPPLRFLMPSCNYFRLMLSRVNNEQRFLEHICLKGTKYNLYFKQQTAALH